MSNVALSVQRLRRRSWVDLVAALVGVALAVVIGSALGRTELIRLVVGAVVLALVVVASAQWPAAAAAGVLIMLPFLGVVRRLLLEVTPWRSQDPLLFAPAAAASVAIIGAYVLRRPTQRMDRMAKLTLFLCVLTFLQAFNPSSPITAGVSALLFTLAPMLWFFVSRELFDARAVQRIFSCALVSATAIALYGISQTEAGFPTWDRMWIKDAGYAALSVGSSVRAFGTFASAAEYAMFIALGVALTVARIVSGRPGAAVLLPPLVTALVLAGTRGVIVTTIAAAAVVVATRHTTVKRATVVLGLSLTAIIGGYLAGRQSLAGIGARSSNPFVQHQLRGLSDPFGKTSTAQTHVDLVANGIRAGFTRPFGTGIGATTIAGEKFAPGTASASSEVDVSNQFIALGLPGGLAYAALVIEGIRRTFRTAVLRRDLLARSSLAVLLVSLGQWANGGYYALSPLVWTVLGGAWIAASATSFNQANPTNRAQLPRRLR